MTKIIACDLDDVIANMRDVLMLALNEATKQKIHWRKWHTFHLHEIYPLTGAECIDAFHRYDILNNCLPEPDAVEALCKIAEHGAYIAIVTSRGWHKHGREITQQWLDFHKVPFNSLHITPWPNGSKSACLGEHFEKVDYLIDDSPGNILDAMNSQIIQKPVVVDRPWNQHVCKSVTRVENLYDFLDTVLAV